MQIMIGESIVGPKGPYNNKYTPELITSEMGEVLGRWRLWSTGDGRAYFSVLDVLIKTSEDRSVSMSDVLGHPDINLDGTLLEHAEPMSTRDDEANGFRAAITDAVGVGQYLLGHKHPDFPTSWTELGHPKVGGRVGRMAVRATQDMNRRSQKLIEEIDKKFGLDVSTLFTAA